MSEPKILNLDVLAEDTGLEISIKGEVYSVREMTVDDFIYINQRAEELAGEKSAVAHVENSKQLIKRFIPDLPDEDLGNLNFSQLHAVVAFIKGASVKDIMASKLNGKGEKLGQETEEGNAQAL